MDPFPFGEESTLHLEMHLPAFSESPGLLCGEVLNHDLCLNTKDAMYVGLSALEGLPSLPDVDTASTNALEADLNALSLYPPKDRDAVQLLEEPAPHPSQHGEHTGLFSPLTGPEEAGGGGGGSVGRGKHPLGSPRASLPGCSRCGKVFGSASALSKHCLTHSQKREHVCALCGKAFKRQDHLSGHMLTHQKIKPFVCPEQDCEKSYCDHRSLRRHYELQHGACASKEAPREGAGQESPLLPGRSADGRTLCLESGSFPPPKDPLRCVVDDFTNQKLPVPSAEPVGAALTDSSPANPASCLGSGVSEPVGDGFSEDRLSCPESAASPVVNPGDVSVTAPGESVVTDLTGKCFISEAPLPSERVGPQCCPGSACFPAFQGQKTSSNPPSSSFQWIRNMPVCAKSQKNSVCLAPTPLPTALAGPSRTFSATCEHPDVSSFPFPPFKSSPSESTLRCLEENFQLAQPHNSHPWENTEEMNFPEIRKRSVPHGETPQLFAKEPAASPEPLHLFPALAASHEVLSHPLAAPEAEPLAAGSLQAGFQHPPPQILQRDGPPADLGFNFQDASLDRGKEGLWAIPAFPKESVGLSDFSAQLQRGNAAGSRSSTSSNPLEKKNLKKEKSKDDGAEGRASRSWRPPAVRGEKLGLSCVATPSQVALASFSSGPRRLTIFNRIQGGNIYSLTRAAKEENASAGRETAGAAPLYAENLESAGSLRGEWWQRKEEQQVRDAGDGNAPKWSLAVAGDGNSPSKPSVALGDGTVAPLVIPVSVPVTAPTSQAHNELTEEESPDGTQHKKRKRQTRPKSLFIPPPPGAGPGGFFQSNLRSPVSLVGHLLRDLFQSSPYTPPPMLSPVREGSGLYFSTLSSSSARGDPGRLLGAVFGGVDSDLGFCLLKDGAKISVEPHINVGSRFQAEVPTLRDRSHLAEEEPAASLVWKPWGDIATNPETQDRVTELLNMACSSVMPGGGTNLELALHCLHEARGDVLEALEMLLFDRRKKSESHPLANYRYAGSDAWTPLEKQLFQKAFCIHKKDFYLIQKKAGCSPRRRPHLLPKEKQKNDKKIPRGTTSPSCEAPYPGQTVFPCRECER
ncbi:ZN541 protein, partial [Pterocles burchelli]|nr:ZN541 protein [Pterocles burchelli]